MSVSPSIVPFSESALVPADAAAQQILHEGATTSVPDSDVPVVIRVNDVSKQFVRRSGQAGDLRERFDEWRDGWTRRRNGSPVASSASTFYALQNVSFEVRRGQSFGIVGHNGSGKSTLLKMLTNILKPTSGTLAITGRVGALIEVGAGFHPDLTGRENVFLNGSILGMSRRDIENRMDAIISFAGLEGSIDMPVKRYSSGMYMRLGFSVAAHTNPDILLIDEVLAVGDMLFQRKCLRHLKEFTARGGTLVFVSHAMEQVRQVCDNCVWLDHGKMRFVGPTDQAIDQYIQMVSEREDDELRRDYPEEWEAQQAEKEVARLDAVEAESAASLQEQLKREAQREKDALHSARVRNTALSCIRHVTLTDQLGSPVSEIASGQSLDVGIAYRVPLARKNIVIGVEIFRSDDQYLWGVSNYQYNVTLPVPAGEGQVRFRLATVPLTAGQYRMRVSLFPEPSTPNWDQAPEDVVEAASQFSVTSLVSVAGSVALPVENWQAVPATPENQASGDLA